MKKKISLFMILLAIVNFAGCAVDDKTVVVFQQYVNKIWIAEDKKEAGKGDVVCSFVITSIENQYVEGQYLVSGEEINPMKGLSSTFTGSIDGLTIECCLWNGSESVGDMTLELIAEDKIKAIVIAGDIANEELFFRPYNIMDLDHIVIDDDKTITTEMNKWGSVKIISGKTDINNSYPVSFLVSQQGDVLYEFRASYKTGTTIEEIYINDFNQDELEDVELVTHFEDYTIDPIRWIFYQDAGATFHLENVL